MQKILTAIFTVFGISSVGAAQVNVATETYQKTSYTCPEIQEDLREIRRQLEFNNKSEAMRILDRLIEADTNPVQTFMFMGLVYSHDPYFRCNPRQEREAMRIAQRGAEDACFNKGLMMCQLASNTIRTNGYIGFINGVYYGYGCLAEALVEGSRQ